MADTTLAVLRPDVWSPLSRRLDEAARQMSSAAARDVLSRPLELLALMAGDALAALGEDALAAERLRMLLYLAQPFHTLVDEARALGEASRADGAGSYEPGVIDHGPLVVLALAATRVAPAGAQEIFVRTVHGLALSAAPAEALGRLVPALPEAAALAVILETLYLLDTVGAALKAPLLRPFANDPAERARWKCLAGLLERDLPDAISAALAKARLPESKPPPWSGTIAHEIEDVHPQRAAPGEVVTLAGRFGSKLPDSVRVVFASADAPPVPARVLAQEKDALQVQVPDAARSGWVGLSDDRAIQASNDLRRTLRETLPGALRRACLRGSEVPARLIPSIGTDDPWRPGKHLAVPPRTAGSRFISSASVEPRAAAFASAPAAAARTPTIAAILVSQRSRKQPLCAGQALDVQVLLDAPADPKSLQLLLDPPPATGGTLLPQGKTAQRFSFIVPAEAAQDGLLITALLDASETKSVGPLSMSAPRPLTLVLARPRVLDPARPPIDDVTLQQLVQTLESELALKITLLQLPFVDDEVAVLPAPIAGGDDARVAALLEALSRRALLTPHLESAVWLALLPDTSGTSDAVPHNGYAAFSSGSGFYRQLPAAAARAVAVADPAGVFGLLAELAPFEGRLSPAASASTPKLRLLGSILSGEVVLESVRQELRAAGPGAPIDSGLQAVGLDGRGAELNVSRIGCLGQARPAQLAVLVPVSPEVSAVEIRRGHFVLSRIERTNGRGSLESAALDREDLLSWSYRHDRNARPDVSLALGFGPLATEVLHIDACEVRSQLYLTRYRKADRLRLFASDGWNEAERSVLDDGGKPARIDNPYTALIRRLPDGSFFADAPDDWSVRWFVNGAETDSHARLFRPPSGMRGTLGLRVRNGDDEALIDERPLEA
jgi:hypothetical protein